ncbi:hypothetical protein BFW01_g10819 [Lasiodiplodia theobromae]|uniref:Uncharacterized protein n=1 Tax=Lasiodiplodia theobromae TaxID=45133 RepID=A0A8H7MB44_9PEZI|nr:hypothetical protein BFW01_g10819 [Lasiodiplodia theobromae]
MGHNGVICDMILPHFRAYTEENEKEKNALRAEGFDTSNDSLYSLHGWQPLEQVLQPDANMAVVFEDFVNDE